MQFTRRAGYPLRTLLFGIPLWYMDNEDDEERSRHLDTHGRLPTSDLAVETTMTLALLEMAVTTQCTLAFGEGPNSWLGSETSSNSGSNFAIIFKDAGMMGRASNIIWPHARECAYSRIAVHLYTSTLYLTCSESVCSFPYQYSTSMNISCLQHWHICA